MKIATALSFIILVVLTTPRGFSQAGYSSSSVSMNRSNGVVASNQVIVEEYLNYHRHLIASPKNGNEVTLDLRWGNQHINDNGSAILQIGIATKQITDYSIMPPINMCIVVDKSGSMSEANKLDKVKIALLKFVNGLRPTDIISIVVYDSEASVALAPMPAGDLKSIKTVIESLTPGSSTNLNGGMVLGYEQVLKNYNEKGTNRVILLTDGLANEGVTDPEAIIVNSDKFNKQGIDISTIGVGTNINYTLLQQIAKKGKGLNHFVGDSEEDIKKAFVDELESLLSPIGKDVSLEVKIPNGMKVESILGYSPQFSENTVTFQLDNMNSGLTQIFLIKFTSTNPNQQLAQLPFSAKLNYFSYSNRKSVAVEETVDLLMDVSKSNTYFNDSEVKKNYYIGYMASQLKESARLMETNKEGEAVKMLNETLKEVADNFPQLKDPDIIRVKDILKKSADDLNGYYSVQNTHLKIVR